MKDKIIISQPYIKNCDSDIFESSVRLCANVTMKNPNNKKEETKECYFEFESKYKEYLCPERSDAFVMGLLTTAMENNMDIEFESPISEKLYYQLTTYYIPMVSKYNSNYPMYNIKLFGPYDNKYIENEGAVATGCSGGVDSFYTILRHSENCETKNNRLTHVVFSTIGIDDIVEARIKDNYKKKLVLIKNIALDCNLNAIACYNNLYQFYKFPYKGFNMFYTTTHGSIPYALQKLINIYYASSGAPISKFDLDLSKVHGHDSSVFDLFTTSCMNSENLSFYPAGMEYSRIEKEQYIADFKTAQKYLTVCAENSNKKYNNCSICAKCLRTMVQFYAFNKLANFKDSFDVDNFFKHKAKYIGKMIGLNKSSYVQDMMDVAKENNVKIPIVSYFYAYFWYKPIKFLRKKLGNSLLARKIYYKLNLDYKLDGFRSSTYEIYKDKIK